MEQIVCVCAHTYSVTQSCPPFCDPKDCSPPGSSVHGIFHARILEQVATFLEGRKAEYYSASLMIHKMYSVFQAYTNSGEIACI